MAAWADDAFVYTGIDEDAEQALPLFSTVTGWDLAAGAFVNTYSEGTSGGVMVPTGMTGGMNG
jgi:hypothetical protein